MKIISDAKMTDIQVIGVPCTWKGLGFEGGLESHDVIFLIHEPSGTEYRFKVDSDVSSLKEAAELKARAKLAFIHHLHGESWLLDEKDGSKN